ncbi:hypothetical protein BY996DRAFT_6547361 [Phakopsora pachyrhizi]|nr:hypothetical protein BY996DRAFT_6547361 [Phakopsora pachyrhizi]
MSQIVRFSKRGADQVLYRPIPSSKHASTNIFTKDLGFEILKVSPVKLSEYNLKDSIPAKLPLKQTSKTAFTP